MPYQSQRRVNVVYGVESAYNTQASAGGSSKYLRVSSGGLTLAKQAIPYNEVRTDGLMSRGRHGFRSVNGNYVSDLCFANHDDFLAASFRSTWGAAITVTQATSGMATATITPTGTTITASTGSFITAGLRVGDVITFATGLNAADIGKNLRIVGLTATVITVDKTLTTATAAATWSATRARKLIQGVTDSSFTIEESEVQIDASENFTGCRITSLQLGLQPNNLVQAQFGIIGADMNVTTGAASPYFTAPSTGGTNVPLAAVDAQLLIGSTAAVDITAASIQLDMQANNLPVVGAVVTPDVITNSFQVQGSITALRQDLSKVSSFLSETQLSLSMLLNELGTTNYIHVYIPNMTYAGDQKSGIGAEGPRTATIPLLIGADDRGGAYDATMIKLISP